MNNAPAQIAAILEKIMMRFIETGSMPTAFDSVMGEGAYEKLAGDVYDALRAKAGA